MKPNHTHFAEAQFILDHWRSYPRSYVMPCIRFLEQWGRHGLI